MVDKKASGLAEGKSVSFYWVSKVWYGSAEDESCFLLGALSSPGIPARQQVGLTQLI